MPGRVKCGGTKGELLVAHGCQKRKKLICGMEGEIVVVHGPLPSPALHINLFVFYLHSTETISRNKSCLKKKIFKWIFANYLFSISWSEFASLLSIWQPIWIFLNNLFVCFFLVVFNINFDGYYNLTDKGQPRPKYIFNKMWN